MLDRLTSPAYYASTGELERKLPYFFPKKACTILPEIPFNSIHPMTVERDDIKIKECNQSSCLFVD